MSINVQLSILQSYFTLEKVKKENYEVDIYTLNIKTKYKYLTLHMRKLTCSLTFLSFKKKE